MKNAEGISTELIPISLKITDEVCTSHSSAEVILPHDTADDYIDCIIENDSGSRLFSGYVSSKTVSDEPSGRQAVYLCKTIGAKLELNSVEPEIMQAPSVYDILNKYTTEIGSYSTSLAIKYYDGNFEISSAVNVWNVIEQFFEDVYYSHPVVSPEGDLAVIYSSDRNAELNLGDPSVVSIKSVYNPDRIISHIYAKARGADAYVCMFKNLFAIQNGFYRKKVLTYDNLTELEIIYRARRISREAGFKSFYTQIRVLGESDLKILEKVKSQSLAIQTSSLVGKKVLSYSPDGFYTDIYLYPQSFIDLNV